MLTNQAVEPRPLPIAAPRSGGIWWRAAGLTSPLTMPLAGKRWNPIFAVIEHRGRRSGRRYATPVAARRIPDGFVISLAFGAQVDWYRNVVAADGGTILWRGAAYPVTAPERIEAADAFGAFNLIQRVLMRFGGVDTFIRVADERAPAK